MAFKQIYSNQAIFSQVNFHFTHGEHHHDDLGIHSYIFGEKHPATFQVSRSLFEHFILAPERNREFIHYRTCKQRLRYKRVRPCLTGFVCDFIPVK